MYDFSLTEEQQAIFDMAREFGATNIEPHAVAWDQATIGVREGGLGFRRAADIAVPAWLASVISATPPAPCPGPTNSIPPVGVSAHHISYIT